MLRHSVRQRKQHALTGCMQHGAAMQPWTSCQDIKPSGATRICGIFEDRNLVILQGKSFCI